MGHPELSAEMLATTGHNISGNWGVYDQFAALKWIKENIQDFGGDPNRVRVVCWIEGVLDQDPDLLRGLPSL